MTEAAWRREMCGGRVSVTGELVELVGLAVQLDDAPCGALLSIP
jgi:hypothetical protein